MTRASPRTSCRGPGCEETTDPSTAYEEWYDPSRPEGCRILCPECAERFEEGGHSKCGRQDCEKLGEHSISTGHGGKKARCDRHAFEELDGIGPAKAERLYREFGTIAELRDAVSAHTVRIARLNGFSPDSPDRLEAALKDAGLWTDQRVATDGGTNTASDREGKVYTTSDGAGTAFWRREYSNDDTTDVFVVEFPDAYLAAARDATPEGDTTATELIATTVTDGEAIERAERWMRENPLGVNGDGSSLGSLLEGFR